MLKVPKTVNRKSGNSIRSSRSKGRRSKSNTAKNGSDSQISVASGHATRGSTASRITVKSSTNNASHTTKRTSDISQISLESVQTTRGSTESSVTLKSFNYKGLRTKNVVEGGRGTQHLIGERHRAPKANDESSWSMNTITSQDQSQKSIHSNDTLHVVESTSRKTVHHENKVNQLHHQLQSSKTGQIILRSTQAIRQFVSELAPYHPGQKFRNATRQKWRHGWDLTFSLIAFAVGTSNLSKFPYFCFTHGGSAFLIPYFIFLVFSVFPILYMELLLGQFVQQGVLSVWNIVPIFRGIGYCIGFMLILFNAYYVTSLAWSMIYIWETIYSIHLGIPLPWTTCDNLWNTVKCDPFSHGSHATEPSTEFFKGRVLRYYMSQYSDPDLAFNKSGNGLKHYGFNSKNNLGDPVPDLSLCLLFISLCIFLLVIADIRITGKFVWFTSIVPALILVFLLINSLTLKGALNGMIELMTPNFTSLRDPETWALASIQVFYSTGAGFGAHLTHASHNHFHHDVFWDAIILVTVNSGTSILGALFIFGRLGNLAEATSTTISHVAVQGNGLIFESYAKAIGILPFGATSSSLMFYSMIFIMGFDTVFGTLQAITTGIKDEYPKFVRASPTFFLLTIVAFTYVQNLICVTRGGIWVYNFMETYAAGVSLIMGIFLQTLVITWIWGMEELCDAAIAMTGRTPGLYLRLCWKYISPLSLLIILELLVQYSEVLKYDGSELSQGGQIVGNILIYSPFVSIPLYALFYFIYYDKGRNFKEKVRLGITPENEHAQILAHTSGPIKGRDRLTWKHFLFFGGLKYSPPVRVSSQDFALGINEALTLEAEALGITES